MLAGWAQYVDRCADAENPPIDVDAAVIETVTREVYARESEVLHELYQSVGRQEMTDRDVDAWVRTNVTGFLRLGAMPAQSAIGETR